MSTSPAAQISEGLLGVVAPIAAETDLHIRRVIESQDELNTQVGRLGAELQVFLGVSQTPSVAPVVARVVAVKKKLVATNARLNAVLERLEKLTASLGNFFFYFFFSCF